MFKLIALDMDGTLLREDKTISPESFDAIKNAKRNGVSIILATGRPLQGIKRYLKQLNLVGYDDYAITFNGALIQNIKTSEVIAKNIMSHDDLEYLYYLSLNLKVNIHTLTYDSCLTPKWSKYSQLEASQNEIQLEIVDFTKLDSSIPLVKIMFIDYGKILDEVIKNLPKEVYDKYTVVRSAPYFLEFLNKKVNKGFGVETLADNLGIKRDEVICIGDAGNDVHMIKYAGLGVAMGNAFPEVKKIADYITKTNEENGVAHVINKFILNEKTC
ncbi:MAG: sugar-phosphatase [Clostridiaceae bacterium]|jgi:Cof subfamily protein (haloacid dehalogenase superfamily)|nr:sugar-phosphatase [Clostridiaceae bacterium]